MVVLPAPSGLSTTWMVPASTSRSSGPRAKSANEWVTPSRCTGRWRRGAITACRPHVTTVGEPGQQAGEVAGRKQHRQREGQVIGRVGQHGDQRPRNDGGDGPAEGSGQADPSAPAGVVHVVDHAHLVAPGGRGAVGVPPMARTACRWHTSCPITETSDATVNVAGDSPTASGTPGANRATTATMAAERSSPHHATTRPE